MKIQRTDDIGMKPSPPPLCKAAILVMLFLTSVFVLHGIRSHSVQPERGDSQGSAEPPHLVTSLANTLSKNIQLSPPPPSPQHHQFLPPQERDFIKHLTGPTPRCPNFRTYLEHSGDNDMIQELLDDILFRNVHGVKTANGTIDKSIALSSPEQFTMLVIGANVGPTATDVSWNATLKQDYLGIRKIFVEPVPTLHKVLRKNLQQLESVGLRNFHTENVAISPSNATADDTTPKTMWCFRLEEDGRPPKGFPEWAAQLCSFNKERLTSNPYDTAQLFRGLSDAQKAAYIHHFVVGIPVHTMSVPQLLQKYFPQWGSSGIHQRPTAEVSGGVIPQLEDLMYVQIDAEGYDFEIVSQLPWSDPAFKPCVIVFEHVLLSTVQRSYLHNLAKKHGYQRYSFPGWQNTIFFRMWV